jgi:hypothetical protein
VTPPTREEKPDFFISKASGRLKPQSNVAFGQCVQDGFDKSHFIFTNISTRQQRRVDGMRVESLAGGRHLSISVDVLDDGRVEYFESRGAALLNTQGERAAFDKCLGEFGVPK